MSPLGVSPLCVHRVVGIDERRTVRISAVSLAESLLDLRGAVRPGTAVAPSHLVDLASSFELAQKPEISVHVHLALETMCDVTKFVVIHQPSEARLTEHKTSRISHVIDRCESVLSLGTQDVQP